MSLSARSLPDPSASAFRDDDLAPLVSRRLRVWSLLRRDPMFWFGLIGTSIVIAVAVLAPVLQTHDPDFAFRREGLTAAGDPVGPSAMFPLGTDHLGRDYLSRVVFGARTSLIAGLGANLIATLIGVLVGAIAAFVGNPSVRPEWRPIRRLHLQITIPVESVLMRGTDLALSFPAILLAIALASIVGPSLVLVVLIIASITWAPTARIIYGRVLIVKQASFIEAATAVGTSRGRILRRHIGPHLVGVILVYGTLGVAYAVLLEATLSFLGVGVPPPTPSWGQMFAEHISYFATDPRLLIVPGVAIAITVLSFNLLGDSLRDALDPRR